MGCGHLPASGLVGEEQPWPKPSIARAGMWELLPTASCPGFRDRRLPCSLELNAEADEVGMSLGPQALPDTLPWPPLLVLPGRQRAKGTQGGGKKPKMLAHLFFS